MLAAARRREDARARQPRDLDGHAADAAGAGMNQYPHAGPDRRQIVQAVPRGQAGDRHAGGGVDVEIRRPAHDTVGGKGRFARQRAGAEGDDRIAHGNVADVGCGGDHGADSFQAEVAVRRSGR